VRDGQPGNKASATAAQHQWSAEEVARCGRKEMALAEGKAIALQRRTMVNENIKLAKLWGLAPLQLLVYTADGARYDRLWRSRR